MPHFSKFIDSNLENEIIDGTLKSGLTYLDLYDIFHSFFNLDKQTKKIHGHYRIDIDTLKHSLETNIEPTMGFGALLKGIIASIIGGIGSIPGAVLGGFSLGLAENLGIWKISAGWKDCIAFAILIIFLLIRPSGILGAKTEKEQM